MSLKAPKIKESKYELIPEDSYHAVCFGVVDLGTHTREWQGKERERHEILLMWELPEHRIKSEDENNDRPYAISKRYTFSMHEKAKLREDMESWRGKGFSSLEAADFDFEKLLGANGIIQVIHRTQGDNTYANIATITKLMKTMKKKKCENEHLFWTFRNGLEFPENMPEWIKEIIMDSKEVEMIMDAKEDINNPESGGRVEEWDGNTEDVPF